MKFHTKLKTTRIHTTHKTKKNCYATSIQISASGSGRIFKKCYPVHLYLIPKENNPESWQFMPILPPSFCTHR